MTSISADADPRDREFGCVIKSECRSSLGCLMTQYQPCGVSQLKETLRLLIHGIRENAATAGLGVSRSLLAQELVECLRFRAAYHFDCIGDCETGGACGSVRPSSFFCAFC